MVASSGRPWYAGHCVSRHEHDKLVNIEVIARLDETGWIPLENARHLFGGVQEVELHCSHAKTIKIGEWEMFQLSKKGKKFWIVGEHKKLHHFADLSNLGNASQIQRYIASNELKTTEASGSWILRSRDTEILQVELRQIQGVGHLATASGKIPAFPFDPDCIARIPLGGREIELYEFRHRGDPTAIYDWSSDEAYAARVIRSIANASDPRVKATIGWLEEHGRTKQSLESLDAVDIAAANDALRSDKLAKRLSSDQALLSSLVNAMINDSRILGLIKSKTDLIAEEERTALRIRAETLLQEELITLRQERIASLDLEIESLRLDRIKKIDDRYAELERELAARKENGLIEINRDLGDLVIALQLQADELTDRRSRVKDELVELDQKSDTLNGQLQLLRDQERDVLINIDRLVAITSLAKSQVNTASEKILALHSPLERGVPLMSSDVKEFVESSQLLSEKGKEIMLQFLALLLAGEVPVLTGPDVDDFLLVAESMFANGTSTRLEGDPTIINFEDLWLRPGTNVQTALGVALTGTNSDEIDESTRLVVINRAERSGARFWFPALAAHARRGELSRRLLACVTIQDTESEEAEAVLSEATRLDIRHALTAEAAIVAIASGIELRRDLDPAERPTDLAEAVPVLAPHLQRLTFARAQRAARAIVEAKNLGIPTQPLVELFIVASGTTNIAVVAQLRS
jgi:hypothetical protein